MAAWIKSRFPGVRYREHASRKHGLQPDRYYTIFYKLDGKMVQETVGWSSQRMTEKKAAAILAELQENQRRGEGPRTLKEKRGIAEQERAEEEAADQLAKLEGTTLAELWDTHYRPQAMADKTPETVRRETNLYGKWIGPVIGKTPIKDISPFQVERIKANMTKGGASPRSIEYCLAVLRQILNFATSHGFYMGENPTKKVKRPKYDNRRQRYLTHDEAERLLDAVKKKSLQTYQICVFAYHAGLRANEIFSLQWQDVDLQGGVLHIRDPKNRHNRVAFLTERMRDILHTIGHGLPSDFVFVDDNGNKIERISHSFRRAVNELKLNEGITDPREHVVFHTWRHSFASTLVANGTDLFTVQKLLGHQSAAMVQRYSHLSENQMRAAIKDMEETFQQRQAMPAEVVEIGQT